MSSSSLTPLARTTVFVAALLLAGARVHADRTFAVVRVLTPQLTVTLDELYRASPAARAIIDELERSDLIVHVQRMGLAQQRHFVGTMRFVNAAGGRRFLRVTINERLAPDRRAAALAHELQHAVEVARVPSVIDQASLAALYKTIGYTSGDDPNAECYETEAARRVEARALADFRMAASAANGSD